MDVWMFDLPLINSLGPYNNNPENPISISLLVQKLWPVKVLVPIIIPIMIKFFQNLSQWL